MLKMTKLRGILAGCCLVLVAETGVRAEPLTIRLGYGVAAEEQLWLLIAKPDDRHALRQGLHHRGYPLHRLRQARAGLRSRRHRHRLVERQRRHLRRRGRREGQDHRLDLAREQTRLQHVVLCARQFADQNRARPQGQDDRRQRLRDIGTSVAENGARAGRPRRTDVTIVPISFSAMAESLRSGKIDVGEFPQPFDALLHKETQVTKIFSAKDAIPTDEELIVLVGKDDFLKANAVAIKAFLDDLTAATKFYLERTKEARQILLDTKMVRVPADVFLGMDDYYRDPAMRAEVKTLEPMQEFQFNAGFQKKKADINQLVDLSYLPN